MSAAPRVALVTGGSRGIGRAVCERLARGGLRVHFVFRADEEGAERTALAVAKVGGSATAHRADVAREEDVRRTVAAVLAAEGAVHVLVNNAGVVDDRLVAAMPLESWQRVIATNLTGAFLMAREVVPPMLDQGWGRIVNVTSTSAQRPAAGQAAYAAAKSGLEGLTRALAAEVGHKGIRINAVAPGAIATRMTEALRAGPAGEPRHRWGTPEDVAEVVAFLASDAADYVQGQVIVADGGRSVARPPGP